MTQAIGAPVAPHQLLETAKSLRRELATTAASVDEAGAYPAENMARIARSGLDVLAIPSAYGGCAPKRLYADLELVTQVQLELAAGESSTAQIWMVDQSVKRSLLTGSDIPESTKSALLDDIAANGARICSSAAEPTKKRFSFQMPCRKVDGGVVVTGTKYFATGCEGAKYAQLPVLLEGYPSVEEGGLYFVLARLDAPGVTINHDWDNMGQRATGSCSIRYDDVFIPDGWHWAPKGGVAAFYGAGNISGPASQVRMAANILGMGYGAFDAMREYVCNRVRPSNPAWSSAAEDPIIRHHFGRYSTALAAARAMLMEAARAVASFGEDGGASRSEASTKMMQAKIAALDAAIMAAGEVNRLCGGQSTSNRFRLDRFWRNARTLSTHDSQDIKLQQLGNYELTGAEPPIDFVT